METRRGFIGKTLALAAGSLLLPLGRTAWAKKLAVKMEKLPKLQKVGGWMVAKIKGKQLLLIRETEERIRVLSAVCTHQHCLVSYEAKSKSIQCGCHKSGYDLDGRVTHGPAPAPLPAYQAKLEKGRLILDLD